MASQYPHGHAYDLFVSYSTRDLAWVRVFHDDLVADINRFADLDVSPVLDKARLQPGYIWDEQLRAAKTEALDSAISLPAPSCENQPGARLPFVQQSTGGIRAGTVGTLCLGNSGRNQFTGPGYVYYDMAIQKMFKLHEALSLSLRAESYNLFNHPNYYNPISAYSLDGITQYSQFGQIKSAHSARQFQFGVRLSW